MFAIFVLNKSIQLKNINLARIILLLILSYSKTVYAQTIIFDMSLNQPGSPLDFGPSGLSIIASHLDKEGYTVQANYSPIHYILQSQEVLFNPSQTIVIIPPPIFLYYKNEDSLALKRFVEKGGNLIVFAEHENYFENAEILNKITIDSGIEIKGDIAKSKEFSILQWTFCEASRYNLNNLYFYLSASLDLSKDAESLVKIKNPEYSENEVVGAIGKFGKGKIVVLGDYEFVWNLYENSGIQYGDNLALILNITKSLVPVSKIKSKNSENDKMVFSSSLAKSFFDERVRGLNFENTQQPVLISTFQDFLEGKNKWGDKQIVITDGVSDYFGYLKQMAYYQTQGKENEVTRAVNLALKQINFEDYQKVLDMKMKDWECKLQMGFVAQKYFNQNIYKNYNLRSGYFKSAEKCEMIKLAGNFKRVLTQVPFIAATEGLLIPDFFENLSNPSVACECQNVLFIATNFWDDEVLQKISNFVAK